jgi:hypothetical protein
VIAVNTLGRIVTLRNQRFRAVEFTVPLRNLMIAVRG